MNKYLEFFRMEIKDYLEDRSRFIVWIISKPIMMLIQILIWTAIFSHSGQESIGGFSMGQTIGYFLFQYIFAGITYTSISSTMGHKIFHGELSVNLLKPINLSIAWAFKGFGGRLFSLFNESLPALAFAIIFFGFQIYSYPMFFIALISIFLGYFINFFFSLSWSLAYFKMVNYWPFERIKRFLVLFFMGAMIPINFMPLFLQNVLKYLPFNYISFEPSRIYLGIYSYAQISQIIILQIIWIIILFYLFNHFFKKAIKKFEGVGA